MNVLRKMALLFCIMSVACSSSRVKVGEKVLENREVSEELRPIDNFKEIQMSTVADIYFYQKEGTPTLTISGEKEIIDLIKTSTENGVLKIYTIEKNFNSKGKKTRIEVSAPSVEKIELTGVGDVYMEEEVSLDDLKLSLLGVGNMYIKHLSCDRLSAKLSGVGNMEIAGKCNRADLNMSGVGHIDCRHLNEVIESKSEVEGVGSIKTANGRVEVGGVGSIRTANGRVKNP